MPQTLKFALVDLVSPYRDPDARRGLGSNAKASIRSFLEQWMQPVVDQHAKTFDSLEITWCRKGERPSLTDLDILVYIVIDVHKSVIAAAGGDVNKAVGNDTVLGLTDLTNDPISEVYWDRAGDADTINVKTVAGVAYHEAAHNRSDLDDEMHDGQNALLKDAPSYPTDASEKNIAFFVKHALKKRTQRPGLVPK